MTVDLARDPPLGLLPANHLTILSNKRILPTFLLCFFLGVFGVHRFYVGKVGTGLLLLCTGGGLGVWWIIDLLMITFGAFKDDTGRPLTRWA